MSLTKYDGFEEQASKRKGRQGQRYLRGKEKKLEEVGLTDRVLPLFSTETG